MTRFAILRDRQFRHVFLAQSISTLGDSIAPIAITFAVLEADRSAATLGLVLAARTIPMIVFVLVGGAWADRLPRVRLMVTSDLTRCASQLAFAAILLLPHAPIWCFMLLQAVNGTATAFFRPASTGVVREVVKADRRQDANALLSGATNVSAITGPGLAAIVVSTLGSAAVIAIDGATFALSALWLIGVTLPRRDPTTRPSLLSDVATGLRVVWDQKWLALEILAFAEFQLFAVAAYAVLGPIVSVERYSGVATWALVASVGSIGALAGDAVSIRYRPRRPLVSANIITLACVPIFIALAVGAPVPVLVLASFLYGFGLSLPDTLWLTAMQNHVPDNLISRVSSLDWMGSLVLRPVGLVIAAPAAALFSPAVVLLAVAFVTVGSLIAVTLAPSVRTLRATPAVPQDR